jgi:hypothetical protein
MFSLFFSFLIPQQEQKQKTIQNRSLYVFVLRLTKKIKTSIIRKKECFNQRMFVTIDELFD